MAILTSEGDSKPHEISVWEGEEAIISQLYLVSIDEERGNKGEILRKLSEKSQGRFSFVHNHEKSITENARAIAMLLARPILASWKSFQSRTLIAAASFEEVDVILPNESVTNIATKQSIHEMIRRNQAKSKLGRISVRDGEELLSSKPC